MPLGGSTIIEQAVDNLLGSRVDEVVVVVGYRAQELGKKIAKKPVKIVRNRRYRQGMSTSLIAGLNAIDRRAQAVMIALADQPFVESSLIDELLGEFKKHDRGILIPVCQGRRGHPVILSLRYKERLLALRGDVGARQLIEENPDDVLEVPVESDSVNVDLNTPEDYTKLILRLTNITSSDSG